MSITEQGRVGEKFAREILRGLFKQKNIQQLDWLVKWDNRTYYIVEVKTRELYKPPPFLGTGLDIRQIKLRTEVFNDLGIDTILFVIVKDDLYVRRLSELEALEKQYKFDTRNKIRIYPIEEFKCYKSLPWLQELREKIDKNS